MESLKSAFWVDCKKLLSEWIIIFETKMFTNFLVFFYESESAWRQLIRSKKFSNYIDNILHGSNVNAKSIYYVQLYLLYIMK